MTDNQKEREVVDISKIVKYSWTRRKTFYLVWVVTFALSCLWILPRPRYYTCEVKMAPETASDDLGGLSSIASSFGFNLGGMAGDDAISPTLYPDLFESTEFIVSLFDIEIQTKDGLLHTNYYDYLKNHQKENWLLVPYYRTKEWLSKQFSSELTPNTQIDGGNIKLNKSGVNPFWMSKKDFEIVSLVQDNIICSNDKKTDVTTLIVTDQDPLVCALLADSVRVRLQDFITQYRTSKARMDMEYYQQLSDSSYQEYLLAAREYTNYKDSHLNVTSSQVKQTVEELESKMSMKFSTYQAMVTQLQAVKAKVQEKTPAYTQIKSAQVPVKAAGPKRMLFVAAMLVLSSILTFVWINRKDLHFTF